MAKIHNDRLKNKYGFKGGKYNNLINKILLNNQENISRKITKISKDSWKKGLKKLTTKDRTFIVPSIDDVLPKRSVFISKAAENGKLISDTLRDRLTKNLRDTMHQFTPVTGEQKFIKRRGVKAGGINEKLIKEFEGSIRTTFTNYTKKDKRLGMPSNVHGIAVTEFRTPINNMKQAYNSELAKRNPNLIITKIWDHHPSLSKEPRKGHRQINQVSRSVNKQFVVPLYKSIGGRMMKVGSTLMMHPHDITAPADQVIGCNCDLLFKARVRKTPAKIVKSLIVLKSLIEKALPIGHVSHRKDGNYRKISPDEWEKISEVGPEKKKEPKEDEKQKKIEENVQKFNDIVRDFSFEMGGVFDEDGNEIWKKSGSKDTISLEKKDIEKIIGSKVFTHNHPSGNSFSIEDVMVMLKLDIGEMRVTSDKFDYIIKRKEGIGFSDERNINILKAAKAMNENIRVNQLIKVEKGEMTRQQATERHNNLLWEKLSNIESIGLEYERIERT